MASKSWALLLVSMLLLLEVSSLVAQAPEPEPSNNPCPTEDLRDLLIFRLRPYQRPQLLETLTMLEPSEAGQCIRRVLEPFRISATVTVVTRLILNELLEDLDLINTFETICGQV